MDARGTQRCEEVEGVQLLTPGLLRLDIGGRILDHVVKPTDGVSARAPAVVVGRNFFDDVVHCSRVRAYRVEFADAVRRRDLFQRFECACRLGATIVITLSYSRVSDTIWALVEWMS